MKLTDTHLVLLSAAAQHADRLLVRPDAITDSAAHKLAAKLLRAGLVEAVTARPNQPHWSVNGESQPVGLRITTAGSSAIGIADEPAGVAAKQPEPVSATRHQPRTGTKQALILDLLHRAEGASIDDLVGATGWLPHTTRAALTGLRQKGYALRKSKGAGGCTRYRIGETDQEG
jgi:Protein of unknown function (DUF3489)